MEEKEEEQEWKTAEIVFGRLTKIDKDRKRITMEVRESSYDDPEKWDWIPYKYTINEWTDKDIEDHLLPRLDHDIKIRVTDDEVDEIIG